MQKRRMWIILVGVAVAMIASAVAAPAAWAATVPGPLNWAPARPGDMTFNVDIWKPLTDGGSPITGYHIEVGGDPVPIVVDVPATTTTFATPVTTRGAHPYSVNAFNAIGPGPATTGSLYIIASPSAPRNIVPIGGDQKAVVYYDPPADSGGGYILGCSASTIPNGGFGNVSGAYPITLSGLVNGVSYSVYVSCYNNNTWNYPNRYTLDGPVAGPVLVVPGPPAPPSSVSALAGNKSAAVSWVPLRPVDVTGYVITPYVAGVAQTPINAASNAISVTVTGLADATTYTFTVRAVNSAGAGPQSPPTNAVTTYAVPDPPTSVTATGGFSSAGVSWTPPVNNGGSAITGYVVTPYLGSVAQTSTNVGVVTSTPIQPLGNNAYTFKVAATSAVGTGLPSAASNPVTPTTAPGAPTGVSASPAKFSAVVSWSAPPTDGGTAITTYTATSSPGAQTCSWTSGPLTCTVTGLTAGTAYSFTVTATNAAGTGAASSASATVTPWSGSAYHPMTPIRVLDSRTSIGNWSAKLSSVSARELLIGGANGVPANATAIVANVTVTNGDADSFVKVWPSGGPAPNVSTINFAAGVTIANLATVKLGAGGNLSLANTAGSVDVIIDVFGYYDDGPGDRYNATGPTRYLDSRTPTGGWSSSPLLAGADRDLTVQGAGLLPATATAVVANVTVTNSTAGSFLRVWPSGTARPTISNVNFAAFETIPNLVTIPIGANGKLSFSNEIGSVDVIVDVVGYFDPTSGNRFHPVEPTRVLDDRNGTGLTGAWGPGQTRTLPLTHIALIAEARQVVMNTTVTNGSTGSYLTISSPGRPIPTTSNLNFGPNQTIANLVIGDLGGTNALYITNAAGTVDVIGDVTGYFAPL